jgi:hypothetical protein
MAERQLMVTVVGLLGLDFSGSTTISNILSGLSGTLNVGESHWIVDRDLGCRECGSRPCPVFTEELLAELRAPGVDASGTWWQRIAAHTGASVIVSSDKRPQHFERFGQPDRAILLEKDPRASITSWLRRKAVHERPEGTTHHPEDVERGLVWWYANTAKMLTWIEQTGVPTRRLQLEPFMTDSAAQLEAVAQWLGTDIAGGPSTALEFWNRPLHYIGGNHSVRRLDPNRYFYHQLKVDERWREALSEESQATILGDRRLALVAARSSAMPTFSA